MPCCAAHSGGWGCIHPHSVFSCHFLGGVPLFSTLTPTARLEVGVRCGRAHVGSATVASPCPSLARAPIPPAPIWDQSATWDHRLGHSGDPKLLLSWDEATPVPSDWVGWRCLNRKGTSATTCRGSASLWACAMGVGIRRSQGLRSLVAAAHALTPGLHTDCFEL